MSYDEELARLKKRVSFLDGAVSEVVESVTRNWTNQSSINKSMIKVVKTILERVGKSEASRKKMRKMLSEISKGVKLQEGTIKEIEGFKIRGTRDES